MVRVLPVESFVAPTFRSAFGQMSVPPSGTSLRAELKDYLLLAERQLTTLMDCFFSTSKPNK